MTPKAEPEVIGEGRVEVGGDPVPLGVRAGLPHGELPHIPGDVLPLLGCLVRQRLGHLGRQISGDGHMRSMAYYAADCQAPRLQAQVRSPGGEGAEDGRVKRLTVEGAGRNAPGPFADDILTAYQAMSRWTTLRRSSQAPYRLGLWILCGG